jgi:predicted transcriptional regulator
MAKERGLGEAELAILNYVAAHPQITVGEVADHVARTEGKARTTVQTVMERLLEKGHLVREKIDGVYRYAPARAKDEVLRALVSRFVDRILGGSVEPFVAYLAQDARLSKKGIDDLKQVLDEVDPERKAKPEGNRGK